MSLLSAAENSYGYNVASNLDTAATEFTRKTGSSATNQAFGTLTQSSDSLTGNASYIFGASARVQYSQLNSSGGFNNFIQEFVFKKSTKPSSGNVAYLASTPSTVSGGGVGAVYIDSNGYLTSYIEGITGTSSLTFSTDLCDNKWHHVVVYYGNGTNLYRLYVDGTLQAYANTGGSSITSGIWNLGSYLATDFTTAGSYFDGKIDFAAYYTGANYDVAGMNSFVADHMAEFANRVLSATALTASGLAVQPAITTTKTNNYTASPATASATFPEAIQSARDNFTLLNTYMGTLSLEQWYKFDQTKTINNYGSGGNAGFTFLGSSINNITAGIQGAGALRSTGQSADIVSALGTNATSTEITDGEFSLGFWVKKTTTEVANIVGYSGGSEYLTVAFTANGYIQTNAYLQNTSNTITNATDMTDGNWHYVAVRKTGTTIQMWIDGTSIGTTTTTHSMSGLTSLGFGGQGSSTEQMYISEYYVSAPASVTSTEIANIWTYGQPIIQAASAMPMPTFSRDNALNTYILNKTPEFYFKMDEASGSPINTGTLAVSLTQQGVNFTQNVTSPNYKAYSFTNRDTQFTGSWTATAGTFTSNNRQTIVMYAKTGTVTAIQSLGGAAAGGGAYGNGIFIQQLVNGTIRLRLQDGTTSQDATTSVSFADNNYHMFIGVKDGSSLKLYVDGVERASNASATINLTDSGQFAIAGAPGSAPTASSRTLVIDEFAVLSLAFSAQDAFEAYQKVALVQDTTATALMVQPTASLGFGPTINPGVSTATALLPDPTQLDTIAPTIDPMTVTAMFQMPNFAATKNTNNAADAMTASASGENPAVTAGGVVGALHMNATASFPEAKARIPGVWNADPITTSAEMVQPGLATTQGALIKSQSLNAKAQLPLPPAYFTIADDLWYQRLLLVDYQSNDFNGVTTFFNTSADIVRGGTFEAWTARDEKNVTNSYYGYNLTDLPLPKAFAGTFDSQNRKALRIRNIALTTADGYANTGANWTFETYIKTDKKNQILFVGKQRGDRSNVNYQDFNAAWRLRDGKISLNNAKSTRLGMPDSYDLASFTGFKDIADGEWHHVIIQTRTRDRRIQVFIDGELDIQRFGYEAYAIHQFGYNSADVNSYSDFEISAVASNQGSFVLERETHLNYYAATGIIPVEAAVATASATLTAGTRGKGNRARALMLYFWPTFNAASNYYVGSITDRFSPVGVNSTGGSDVGNEAYDYDTFYGLSTYLKDTPEQFYDWDIFPLPVTNFVSGDTYRGDKHPLLNDSVILTVGTGYGTIYTDPVTGNIRYLDLMKDVYEIDQYDAIFFRNYPDQSIEQDSIGLNSKSQVDDYFNIREKDIFEKFLNSLRETIDTYNINLFVTNPQLAKDLGIIANVSEVDLLRDNGNFYSDEYSDNRAPVVTGRVNIDGTAQDPVNQKGAGWYDTWFNDRHRVINTLEYLTDDNTFIWTDYAFYQNADEFTYGGPDRLYKRYENRPYGLQIDDEFVFADSGNPKYRAPYQAVKPSDVLAGIPITALSKKIWNQNYDSYVQVDNPFKDYVTTIAVPIGTNLKGKLTGGKIFVSFSENVGNNFTAENGIQSNTSFVEWHQYDIASKYWVEIAYNAGVIDAATRAQYLAGTAQQPPLYDDNNSIKQYWSLSGDNVISRIEPVTQNLTGFVGGDINNILIQNPTKVRTRNGLNGLPNSTRLRDALGRFASGGGASGLSGGSLQGFKITVGRTYDTGTIFTPSINTRGLWWLSEKVIVPGTVVGIIASTANAILPQPIITADHPVTVNASAMIAIAQLNETSVKGPSRTIITLPLVASATIVGLGGKNVLAGTGMAANATIVPGFVITQGADQVIMYLHHVNPILYLRKEIIR